MYPHHFSVFINQDDNGMKTGHKVNQPLGEYDNFRDAALGTVDLMAL